MSVRSALVVKIVVRGVKCVSPFRVSSEGCSLSEVCLFALCEWWKL